MSEKRLDYKMTFGKHKGLTIKEIIEDDPTYLEWAIDNIPDFELDDAAFKALEKALGQDDPLDGVFY